MPVSAETQHRLSSNEKTLPTYIVNFYGNTEQKSIPYRKKILSASVCKKILRNVSWNISVAALQRPMSTIVFSIQSFNNIWMMSIRKCSIGVIGWYFFFKPRSIIFPGRRQLAFFRSVSVNHRFEPSLANVFLAKQVKACRCRPKHNFGWARTKKPRRPTL